MFSTRGYPAPPISEPQGSNQRSETLGRAGVGENWLGLRRQRGGGTAMSSMTVDTRAGKAPTAAASSTLEAVGSVTGAGGATPLGWGPLGSSGQGREEWPMSL